MIFSITIQCKTVNKSSKTWLNCIYFQEQNPGNCNPNPSNPWIIPNLTLYIIHRDEGSLPDNTAPVDTAQCSILPGFASAKFDVINCREIGIVDVIDVNAQPKYMTINLTLLVSVGEIYVCIS